MAFPISRVSGLEQLSLLAQQMAALGPQAEMMARATMEDMAERAEDLAREIVPYDTGKLHDSIFSKPTLDRLGFELGATMDYAGFVEFGTVRMAPQPYLRPAIETVSRLGISTMNSLLRRML